MRTRSAFAVGVVALFGALLLGLAAGPAGASEDEDDFSEDDEGG